MAHKKIILKCLKCNKVFTSKKTNLNCDNHDNLYNYLDVVYDYDNIKFPLKHKKGIERYMPLLPINNIAFKYKILPVPLVKMKSFNSATIFAKDETRNFTGSFKDKESMVVLSKAKEFNIKNVFCVSSGNAAHSLAAMSRVLGLKCDCYVANNTVEHKIALIELCGGVVHRCGEDYEACYRQVHDINGNKWNCSSGANPYNLEGNKITAFEIFEEIGVPDKIIVPCGNGTNLAGIYKGFWELKRIGLTKRIPQMIGVQIKGAAPLKEAYKQGKDFVVLESAPLSFADAIIAKESYSSYKVMKALDGSNGKIVTVTDIEIKKALLKVMQEEALFIEPSSASVFAALSKINIRKGERVVCVITGSGLKTLDILKSIFKG